MNDEPFSPTVDAALHRLAGVIPDRYARSRNHLEGAVTGLSPYVTHGLLDLPDALRRLRQRHALDAEHRLIQEFGWREFFHHVWRHRGDGIFDDQRPPIYRGPYATRLPEDVLRACTGVPVIDQAVTTLYRTGYLHNHARLWLASYLIHWRKVHWRSGADWLYGYLLDGDLASNHLSWQWVAGTFSVKPYLFNADNVARFAPAAWHSPGTVIDDAYEALDERARHAPDCGPEPQQPPPVAPPALLGEPVGEVVTPQAPLDGRRYLVHPWSLGPFDPATMGPAFVLLDARFHRRFPWSARRWRFVMSRLAEIGEAIHWVEDSPTWLAQAQAPLAFRSSLNPAYRDWCALPQAQGLAPPRCFTDPDRLCSSFSRFRRDATLQA